MDQLDALFRNFSPSASVFFSGNLCQTVNNSSEHSAAVIHVLYRGTLLLKQDGRDMLIDRPSFIFSPYGYAHELVPQQHEGVDMVCANLDVSELNQTLFRQALGELLVIPMDELPQLEPAVRLLFAEAFAEHQGREAALNRLLEYAVLLFMRYLIDKQLIRQGVLAALGDEKLSRAVKAMHLQPQFPWSLESLADEAGMSRARFASQFKTVTGLTPMAYLQDWRLKIARQLLAEGRSVKAVARRVGYLSPAALTRAYNSQFGHAPSAA